MKISQSQKVILEAVGPLVIIVFLSIFVGRFAIGKILEVRDNIVTSQRNQAVLKQKLDVLTIVSSSIGSSPNIVVGALPDKNPSLMTLSQLKLLSSQNSILVSDLKTSAATKDASGLSRVDITFDLQGSRPQIFSFVKSIGKIAPITHLAKFRLSESEGVAQANIVVSSYFAPLPTKLPAVNSQIQDLTTSDKTLITQVSQLTQPQFVEIPATGATGENTNPFGQ